MYPLCVFYTNVFCPEDDLLKSKHVAPIHYRDADKSLARPGRKQATVTEDFDFHISYL